MTAKYGIVPGKGKTTLTYLESQKMPRVGKPLEQEQRRTGISVQREKKQQDIRNYIIFQPRFDLTTSTETKIEEREHYTRNRCKRGGTRLSHSRFLLPSVFCLSIKGILEKK